MRNNWISLMSFNAGEKCPTPIWYPSHQAWSFAEYEIARSSIENFASAEVNWDGYGALRISDEAKNNALTALAGLRTTAPAPAVIPNPNGTLSFEWESDQGIGQLEIGRTRYSFYIRPNVGESILMDGNARQIFALGSLIGGRLYPQPSQAAYSRISTAANV